MLPPTSGRGRAGSVRRHSGPRLQLPQRDMSSQWRLSQGTDEGHRTTSGSPCSMRRWFYEERPIVPGIPACSVRFVVPSTADRERGAVTTHSASCRTSIAIAALLCVYAGVVLYSVGERDGALDEQL